MDHKLVRALLKDFDLTNSPNAIVITSASAQVLLLKQRDGYHGVPITKDDHMASRCGFSVTLLGSGSGLVTPAQSTNFLAQQRPGSREKVDPPDYHAQLNSVLTAVVAAAKTSGQDMPAEVLNEHLQQVYPWLSVVAKASKKSVEKAILAGVPEFILEHVELHKVGIEVDPAGALAHAIRWNSRFICVDIGDGVAWDQEAQRLGKDFFVPSGVMRLVRDEGGIALRRHAARLSTRAPIVAGDNKPVKVLDEETAAKLAQSLSPEDGAKRIANG